MKLLCVSHPSVLAANQTLFAAAADLTGWDVTLVAPSVWRDEFGRFEFERLPAFRGRVVPLRVLGQGRIPLHVYVGSLSAVVREERPDVVFMHHEAYALATHQVVRALRGTDTAIGFYAAQNVYKRYPWPFSRFEREAIARASFAFPVTERAAGVLRSKGFTGTIETLPLPVDVDAFLPAQPGRHAGLTLGFVGRLVPIKGVETLLEALAGLPDDVTAIMVGDGPNRAEYERYAKELGLNGRVHWDGYVSHTDVPAVYSRFDALVVPSLAPLEQFGRVVVESLAAGVPVIASDAGELPRLIAQTGGGWLFRSGDADALRRVIEEVREHPEEARRRAEHGRQVVVEDLSVRSVAKRFVEVVERAAAEAGR